MVRTSISVLAIAVLAGCGGAGDDGAAPPACGDGVVDPGEECDDGNASFRDDCLPSCRLATCGDFAVRSDAARPEDREECDAGGVDTAGCDADCTLAACGDHHRNPLAGEVCDDGNAADGDGCSVDCRSDETCGNGIVDVNLPRNPTTDPGTCLSSTVQGTGCAEVCDDGNTVSGDGCSANCLSDETCPNDIRDQGENCDDGNQNWCDACPNNCLSDYPGWVCGDGVLSVCGDEQCDPGAMHDTPTCDWAQPPDPQGCTFAACGDGHVNAAAGEQCDRGVQNGMPGSPCTAICTLAP